MSDDLLAGFPVRSFTTAAGSSIAEIEIKRSRFIARVAHAESEDQARSIIEEERSAHPKARHWCTAFVLGPDGRTQRFNDDGEPSGTAGQPILDVLVGHELTDTVAVVTRYFGGTLLGAGGLVRAYGGAASAAVDTLTTRTRRLRVPISAELDYPVAEQVRVRAEQSGWTIADAQYAERVTLTLGVDPDEITAAEALLADASAGAAAPEVGLPRYV